MLYINSRFTHLLTHYLLRLSLWQSDDDGGLDLEEVVNSAFQHLRHDLVTRPSPAATDLSIARHVTVTSSSSGTCSAVGVVKPSRLPQSPVVSSKLSTSRTAPRHDAPDSTVVKAHSGNYDQLFSLLPSSIHHSFISLLPTNIKTHSPLRMTKTYYDYVTR